MIQPTILVVDDDFFFRRLLDDILAEQGSYRVETASSGEEALERVARGGIDVLLTDMVMPGICGLELLKRLRMIDAAPEVVFITGNATVESAIQALKDGARDYLIKPCDPEQLRRVIRNCLDQRRLLAENFLLRDQLRLYQKGQQLAAKLDLDRLMELTLNSLAQEMAPATRSFACLIKQGQILQIFNGCGLNEEQAQALSHALAPRLAQIDKGELLDATTLELTDTSIPARQTLWLFPLKSSGEMQALLALLNPLDGAFPERFPRETLIFLGEQAALGFNNACQYEDTKELVYSDDLTGLYNHRYLHIALEQEIRRSERYDLEFSVAFIDLDQLKQVNDRHGHLAGSSVLRQVGSLLRDCVRDADLLFRYGGDEFTALLVETDRRGAKVVAERIRKSIEEYTFSLGGELTCRLTATIGYATYPVNARSKQELIDLADRAMYQGKASRNTICSAADLRSP
mgnify:CR=1 FL=1